MAASILVGLRRHPPCYTRGMKLSLCAIGLFLCTQACAAHDDVVVASESKVMAPQLSQLPNEKMAACGQQHCEVRKEREAYGWDLVDSDGVSFQREGEIQYAIFRGTKGKMEQVGGIWATQNEADETLRELQRRNLCIVPGATTAETPDQDECARGLFCHIEHHPSMSLFDSDYYYVSNLDLSKEQTYEEAKATVKTLRESGRCL